ncbi:MAG: hypothetical protein OXU20_12910 [Myxococcales bacterium]|nr:hypothetical protein [Myxococcales bacterium]MDD9971664.1 hypothetical protein [Myxococcales bacterium]
MLKVDEFESVFRAASREPFALDPLPVPKVLVVTDLQGAAAVEFVDSARRLLGTLGQGVVWAHVGEGDFSDTEGMLAAVKAEQPTLVCSYRDLRSSSWRFPYSLGAYLNVLVRHTELPVVVLPNPHEVAPAQWRDSDTDSVMVVADHLAGDNQLVSWGVRLTRPGGVLHLTHVEDDATFERYLDAISKIASIDTDNARTEIREQLLKEPRDYIRSAARGVAAAGIALQVHEIVVMGHRMAQYKSLVTEQNVDLLLFHGTQDGQLAMHGTGYLLTVELRRTPLVVI